MNPISKFPKLLMVGAVLTLTLCVAAPVQAQLPRSAAIDLSSFTANPTVPLEGFNGGVYQFSIGGTTPSCSPIYLGNSRNIGFTLQAQSTNTTSTVGLAVAFFSDVSSSYWNAAISNTPPNGVSFRYMSLSARTTLQSVTTNWSCDGYLYAIPLYVTNANQMVSNLVVRYTLKPGM